MNTLISLSSQDLRRAAEIKEKIESLQNELSHILGSNPAAGNRMPKRPGKTSAKIRAQIAAGARAGSLRAVQGPQPKVRKKRSAVVRARLAAIAKERWRKAKAAGKTRL